MLVDSHCHLNFYEDGEIDNIIESAKNAGVEKFINIGTSLKDSQRAISQAVSYPNVYSTVGIHPNDDQNITTESIDWTEFEKLARSPRVVAIGECGLDYSHITEEILSVTNEKERQKKLFIQQVKLANKLNLSLTIHIRDAYDDILEILNQVPHPIKAVFHCMSGSPMYLENLLQLQLKQHHDFYFSFAGNITFKNAQNIRDLAFLVPLNKTLIETDCPFLAPDPHRGSRNTPANVKMVAEKLAEIKKTSFEEIARITSENSQRLFKI